MPAACLVVDFPYFGPPQFRYTGSDPNTHAWNLGWPLATAIYDQHSGLHAGPLAYVLVPIEVVVLVGAAIAVSMSRSRRVGGRPDNEQCHQPIGPSPATRKGQQSTMNNRTIIAFFVLAAVPRVPRPSLKKRCQSPCRPRDSLDPRAARTRSPEGDPYPH